MKVPRSFELFGQTIKVKQQAEQSFEINCVYGHWVPSDLEITIRKDLRPDTALHTFWHEFFHAALESCGKKQESADETFVDTLAGLTVQMLKTARY